MNSKTKASSKARPKVSVVIPVYGVEQYIERCARSLFEQTLESIEYIFVDDCSPDNSIEILRHTLGDYPKRKEQTRIVRMPENSGQAAVRKRGTLEATGEYIVHCDSDDWVDHQTYELAYNAAKEGNHDIVFFDFYRTDGTDHRWVHRIVSEDKEKLLASLLCGKLMGSVWGGVYRRNLWEQIAFPQYNMIEDLVMVVQLVYYANSIGYLPRPLYYYYYNPRSITTSADLQARIYKTQQAIPNLDQIQSFLKGHGLLDCYQNELFVAKAGAKRNLSYFMLSPRVRRLWHATYPEANCRTVFRSSVMYRNDKIVFILSVLGIYPIFKRIKNLLKQ